MSSSSKLYICSNFSQSHFLRVSKTTVILLEILPFLTQAQIDGGDRQNWFTDTHFQELIGLLEQNGVKNYVMKDSTDASGKKHLSRFIVNGTVLRAACIFTRSSEDDICLISKKSKGRGKKFQEIKKFEKKLVIHVCPKTNSSVLNVSQLIETDTDANGSTGNEQISKYFKPISNH